MKITKIILFIFLTFSQYVLPQTKSYGNYEVYTYETSRNGLGFLTMDINFPDYLNSYTFKQKGLLYTYQYYKGEIGSVNLRDNLRLRFITEGNFNIGGAYSSNEMYNHFGINSYSTETNMYSVKLDLYSFDIGTEVTFVFDDGIALTAKLGLNIFSIGGSAAMPQHGKLNEDAFAVVNLVPFLLRPQLLFDFGRSNLGIGFLIHPKNFIEYKYVPTTLFKEEDKGIIFNDNLISDFAVELMFYY